MRRHRSRSRLDWTTCFAPFVSIMATRNTCHSAGIDHVLARRAAPAASAGRLAPEGARTGPAICAVFSLKRRGNPAGPTALVSRLRSCEDDPYGRLADCSVLEGVDQ